MVSRLKRLNAHLPGREYLVDDRFTIADITVGYALCFAETLGLDQFFEPVVSEYLARLKARPAFQKANAVGAENSLFKPVKYPFENAPELM